MDWIETLSQLWGPVSVLINVIVGWVIWSLRQSFARKDDLNKLAATVGELKSEVGHLPTGRETNALSVQMATLHGDVRTLEAKLSGLGRSLDRVERPLNLLFEHELKGGSR